MDFESKRLYKLVDEVVAYTGEKGGEISVAQTLAAQMEKFVKRPDKIPGTLSNFKENISSLGTSINNLSAALHCACKCKRKYSGSKRNSF